MLSFDKGSIFVYFVTCLLAVDNVAKDAKHLSMYVYFEVFMPFLSRVTTVM